MAREGEGRRRASGALTKHLQNRELHPFGVGENVVVPEPKNTPAPAFEPRSSFRVVHAIGMLPAIGFDHQSMLDAGKVDNEGTKWVLTTKFEALQSPIAQCRPEPTFGIGHRTHEDVMSHTPRFTTFPTFPAGDALGGRVTLSTPCVSHRAKAGRARWPRGLVPAPRTLVAARPGSGGP